MRNGLRSRETSSFEGHSVKVENVCKLDLLGSDEDLQGMARLMPTIQDCTGIRRKQKQATKA